MGMLTGNQKQAVSQFQKMNREQQAQEIVNVCNQNGISKEQFTNLMNVFNQLKR